MYHLKSANPFSAETEATVNALTLATDLKLDKVEFESDASNLILALKGLLQFDDWRDFDKLEKGRALFACNLFWNLAFIPPECNSTAHYLANWASGPVPPNMFDPGQKGVGT